MTMDFSAVFTLPLFKEMSKEEMDSLTMKDYQQLVKDEIGKLEEMYRELKSLNELLSVKEAEVKLKKVKEEKDTLESRLFKLDEEEMDLAEELGEVDGLIETAEKTIGLINLVKNYYVQMRESNLMAQQLIKKRYSIYSDALNEKCETKKAYETYIRKVKMEDF